MKDIEEEGNRIGSVSQFVKANNARMSLCMVRPGLFMRMNKYLPNFDASKACNQNWLSFVNILLTAGSRKV